MQLTSINHSFLLLSKPYYKFLAHHFFFLCCLVFTIPSQINAQEINNIPQPDWVKDNLITYDYTNNLEHPISKYKYGEMVVYKEFQVNVDKQESFLKSIFKIPENNSNHHEIDLSHSSKDMDRSIISLTLKKKDQDIDITKNLNWNENETKEYVFNRLWESHKRITLSIDKVKRENFYSLRLLNKNIRDDYQMQDGYFYSVRDSIQVYFRLISNEPLSYKSFNGFPEVKENKFPDYYEYVAEGFANSPYKNKTPNNFISYPFICFSKFENIEEVGSSFSKQFKINQQSIELLDELYEQLSKNETNDSLIVKNIINYVQDTMVYQDYGLYRSYQPYWCINGNRGDCKAKTNITIELLKRLGIKAFPVLVNSPKYISQLDDIPSLANFNHVMVQFIFKNDTILVDPTSTNQGDKIGAYYIPDYQKGLAIYDNEIKMIDIPSLNKGQMKIYDEISDRVTRKIIFNGKIASKYQNNSVTSTRPESLFEDNYFRMNVDNYSIHHMDHFYLKKEEPQYGELEKSFYNSISQDSAVLFQEMYYPDSIKRSFISTEGSSYRNWSSSSSFGEKTKDSLCIELWPLDYINQVTNAKYYKEKIPLAEMNLDTFDTEFILKQNFGFYKCTIVEDDECVTVQQHIFVSGGLPANRLDEYDIFEEKMNEHRLKVKNLLLRKKLERSPQEKMFKIFNKLLNKKA